MVLYPSLFFFFFFWFCSIPVASLPPLEWPIPSRTDQYELNIEVQPKPHHRAHYETEGSRGAVKAPTGGHPVIQVTSDTHTLLNQASTES